MNVGSEIAYETNIHENLLPEAGWVKGDVAEWDKEAALFPSQVIAFIQDTQPDLWQQMHNQHGDELASKLIKTLVKELDSKGMLHVLRRGFKFYGKVFHAAYYKPAHGLNPEVQELYAKNRLTVTRQVPCHPNDNSTIDLVFALNGFPIATCELKNPATGQTFKHAIHQYKNDRDPRAPLFKFRRRALVHFAVDPDEVWMTTRLMGDKTRFLPFNRGSHPGQIQCGSGNPVNPDGYRTGYLWEQVLQRDSILDIVGRFLFVQKKKEKIREADGTVKYVTKETLIFPRYHQLDAVRKLISATREENVGNNYLVQHSAGSGKTNSISWLAHRLANLHTTDDQKIFDCVIVISDRRVLDQQLQDAVYQIEHAQGVIKAIDQDSKQLANALIDGTKIVVTTLQKFPFVLKGLLNIATGGEDIDKLNDEQKKKALAEAKEWEAEIAKRKYAVIVDEAHSSQTGDAAMELHRLLSSEPLPADATFEDVLNQTMEARGQQRNLNFYAFTATPKGKTLQVFKHRGASEQCEPFHIYSMRQAIEEKFILDVLLNYTTYKTFFKLMKAIDEDPELPKKKAVKVFRKFAELHPHNIRQKIELIVEHFRANVKHQIGGKAKAMVVTTSRLEAVRYKLAFEEFIKEKGYTDVRPLVAFSGTVKDPDSGLEYTEPGMNLDVVTGKKIGESQLPDKFDGPDYQVLLVANKYQTGFDQPLLYAMYVDKRLDGVQAVQTLSRLNRMHRGKTAPFVLDFVNEAEDIYTAFKPFYDGTSLQEKADLHRLEELKHELDNAQVYHWPEIEAFAEVFYKPPQHRSSRDHQRLEQLIQPSIQRFNELEEEQQKAEFRAKLQGYVSIYSFMSQIMPYDDRELEMLYSFSRFLLPHLKIDRDTTVIHPGDEIDLEYYRLEKQWSGEIKLKDDEQVGVRSPTDVGTGKAKDERAPLSEIITILNDRFGTAFTDEDKPFFEQIHEKAMKDDTVIQTAEANPEDKFKLGIQKLIKDLIIQRHAENDDIVTRYVEDEEFQRVAFNVLASSIYRSIRQQKTDR